MERRVIYMWRKSSKSNCKCFKSKRKSHREMKHKVEQLDVDVQVINCSFMERRRLWERKKKAEVEENNLRHNFRKDGRLGEEKSVSVVLAVSTSPSFARWWLQKRKKVSARFEEAFSSRLNGRTEKILSKFEVESAKKSKIWRAGKLRKRKGKVARTSFPTPTSMTTRNIKRL